MSNADKPNEQAGREWQAAVGSSNLHVLDLSSPGWKTSSGRRRRSGPRSLCGRYPQRNADGAWFSFRVAEAPAFRGAAIRYMLTFCPDCLDRLAAERAGAA